MSVLIDRGLLEKYPIDLSVLIKGDVIDVPTMERITGYKWGTKEYNFEVMSLRSWIEKHSREDGIRLISKNRHGNLEILTDEEAARYVQRHATLGRRRFYRNHRRQLDVEIRNLTDETRKEHERSILCNGRMITAMHNRKELPEAQPRSRATPLLGNDEVST